MNRQALAAIACGVVPMAMVHFAYFLNVQSGEALAAEFVCNPYLEGCVSTSRAVRSGPGLLWFKVVMLPYGLLLALAWRYVNHWMAGITISMRGVRRWTLRLGVGGAIALVFYVIYLGTEGPVYSWLRRYGIIFFFGFTALAQLVAARFLVGVFPAGSASITRTYLGLVSLQWGIGVFSAVKRLVFEDAELIDRLENITEWFMIATMSLCFAVIGLLIGAGATRR